MNARQIQIHIGLGLALWLADASWATAQERESIGKGVLIWKNGDRMGGWWEGVENGWLTWSSGLLAEPVKLWMPRLHGWQSDSDGAVKPMSAAWCLRLMDGSVLGAEELRFSNAELLLRTAQNGEVVPRPGAVQEIMHLGAAGAFAGPLLFAGPSGLGAFTQKSGDTPGQAWDTGEAGVLRTSSIDQAVTLPLEMPDKVRIDLWLRGGEAPPKFSFHLRNLRDQTLEIETWMDTLVGRGDGRFADLRTVASAQIALVLCVDFKARTATAFDLAGKPLGTWKVRGSAANRTSKGKPARPGGLFGAMVGVIAQAGAAVEVRAEPAQTVAHPKGLTLVNEGAELTLERLLVREWNGQPPAARSMDESFVETVDGRVLPGRGTDLSDGLLHMDGDGQTVALNEVAWMHLRPAPIARPANPATPEPGVRLTCRDGSLLKGLIQSSDGQSLVLRHDLFERELQVETASLERLQWYLPEVPASTAATAGFDLWERGQKEDALRGHWQPGAGSVPLWRPDGAQQAVPVRATNWRFIRALPQTSAEREGDLTGLAYTHDGEIVPMEVREWREKDALVVSPLAVKPGVQKLAMAQVRAMELAGPGLRTSGFGDPGWVLVRGGPDTFSREADGQTIVLHPGAAFAHGSFLQGNELSFNLGSSQAYSCLRLRLFCEGLQDKPPHLSLLVSRSGTTVYCGTERPERPGEIRGSCRMASDYDKPARVTLKWTAQHVELYINDAFAFKEALPEDKRSGLGLMLEPASMWGNRTHESILTGFALQARPGARSRPSLDADMKKWALQVPRRMLDDPPRHLLVAGNGDLLRGTVEEIGTASFTLRSGLETLRVPRERVAMLVLPEPLPPSPPPEGDTKTPAKTEPDAEQKKDPDRVWITTLEGACLRLQVKSFGPEWITGTSDAIGPCRIAADQVAFLGTDPADMGKPLFEDWRLVSAPEPDLPESSAAGASPLIGTAAPDFTLPMPGGGSFSLKQKRGQVVVLDFWATWCGPCLKAIPEMLTAVQELPAGSVHFIGINQAQPEQEVTSFLKTRGWDLAVALDGDQAVGRLYGVEGIPHTVVIGPDGQVAWVKTGYSSSAAAELVDAIRKVLPAP